MVWAVPGGCYNMLTSSCYCMTYHFTFYKRSTKMLPHSVGKSTVGMHCVLKWNLTDDLVSLKILCVSQLLSYIQYKIHIFNIPQIPQLVWSPRLRLIFQTCNRFEPLIFIFLPHYQWDVINYPGFWLTFYLMNNE